MVHVVLVSGWQTVNIGDIAHSPGVLEAFRRFSGEAVRLTFWARSVDNRVRELLARYFPEVNLVEVRLGPDGALTPELEALFADADILVHGAGPSLVARPELEAWRRHTGKPYGIFGITVDPLVPYHATLDRSGLMIDALDGDMLDPLDRALLGEAAFVYCRDSLTMRFLQSQGLPTPDLAFGPDATVLFDVVDDDHATDVLGQYGLRSGEFLCAVPRARYTPYYLLRGYAPAATDRRKEAYSAGYLESDLDVLRQGVVSWVRDTGTPALIVPEMSYAVEMADKYLAGTFPADVADRVHVLPRFWGLAEATAVYRQAGAIVSMECHTPLLALAAGVPALYLRQPTDTIKGQMYADLGLADAVVELTSAASAETLDRLASIIADPAGARERAVKAREGAHDRLRGMVAATMGALGDKTSIS